MSNERTALQRRRPGRPAGTNGSPPRDLPQNAPKDTSKAAPKGELSRRLYDTEAASAFERVIAKGDLAALTPEERIQYYRGVCESVGLNPLTRPFEYIELDGKLTLYARKDATEQLRALHGVSITRLERDTVEAPGGDIYVVTAYARDRKGREDSSTGAVSLFREKGEWRTSRRGKRYFHKTGELEPLQGDQLANALMKAETKAKRRVTLSLCGLGWLDETELDTIEAAHLVEVDHETGEVHAAKRPAKKLRPAPQDKPEAAADNAPVPEADDPEAAAPEPDAPDAAVSLKALQGYFSNLGFQEQHRSRRLALAGALLGEEVETFSDLSAEKRLRLLRRMKHVTRKVSTVVDFAGYVAAMELPMHSRPLFGRAIAEYLDAQTQTYN